MGDGKTLTPGGSVNDGNGGANYTVSFVVNTTGQITVRAITVTAAANTKTYDGTTTAAATPTVTGGSLATGDTAAFTETYDTNAVGTGKTLTAAGSVNDGNGGANYAVTKIASTTGVITNAPYISLNNGIANSFTGGQGTWIQIPVRVDNLQDSSGDTGLESEGVELNYSTTVNVAAQNVSQPADSGFTESGNTVTVITQSSSGFVKGEAVTITAWNNPAYDGTFTIASVGATSFTYTDTGVTGLTPSGGGTATASFFDQGTPQAAASEKASIKSGRPNYAPVVVQGPLLPSTWGWNAPAGNAGTVTISNLSPNAACDITTTDPTNGGTSPDGDILAYVFLHVISGTTSAAYDSSIPISVVSGVSTYLDRGYG